METEQSDGRPGPPAPKQIPNSKKERASRLEGLKILEAVGSTGVDHPEKTYGDSLAYYNQGATSNASMSTLF